MTRLQDCKERFKQALKNVSPEMRQAIKEGIQNAAADKVWREHTVKQTAAFAEALLSINKTPDRQQAGVDLETETDPNT